MLMVSIEQQRSFVSVAEDTVKKEQEEINRNELRKQAFPMLGWSMTFLIIALIAAVFGFTGIVSAAVGIAKFLFVVFLILFVLSLLFGRRSIR
ncbi:uncharacterized membrane protein YtjA (UPF0391 family) [Brevibacillus nitrificans]|nr:uncharacterized membrane protein YtjA (UPF0391 family) [Brevibacillus nitrificans]